MNPSNSGKWPKTRSARGERRKRTIYTKEQVARLTEAFEAHPYPGYEARERLARQIGIPEARIHVWFQNRRARQPRPLNSGQSGESSRQEDPSESRLAPGTLDYSSLAAGPVWGDSRPQGRNNWTFLGQPQTFEPLEGSQEMAPSTLHVPASVGSPLPVMQSSWDAGAPSGSGLVPTIPQPTQQHHLLQPPLETYSYPPYHPQETPQLGDPFYSTQPCSAPDPALSLHGASDLEGSLGLGLTQGSATHGEMPQPGFYGNEAANWENWR